MADPLAARRGERAKLIASAAYVERLRPSLELVAAAVAGSVARGDFNVWSDVDVVVARGLPERAVDRAGLLLEHAHARVQPVGYTPDEFAAAVSRGDPLACEARDHGVVLAGGEFFVSLEMRCSRTRVRDKSAGLCPARSRTLVRLPGLESAKSRGRSTPRRPRRPPSSRAALAP